MIRSGLLFFNLLLVIALNAQYDTLVLNGYYQGKELRILYSRGDKKVNDCIVSWSINGENYTDQKFNKTFDLFSHTPVFGTPLEIKIIHHSNCTPVISNPDVIWPRTTYEMLNFEMQDDSLVWETRGETGILTWYIEHYTHGEWQTIGEMEALGTPDTHIYKFPLTPSLKADSLRVFQIGFGLKKRASSNYDLTSMHKRTGSNAPQYTIPNKSDSLEILSGLIGEWIFDYSVTLNEEEKEDTSYVTKDILPLIVGLKITKTSVNEFSKAKDPDFYIDTSLFAEPGPWKIQWKKNSYWITFECGGMVLCSDYEIVAVKPEELLLNSYIKQDDEPDEIELIHLSRIGP